MVDKGVIHSFEAMQTTDLPGLGEHILAPAAWSIPQMSPVILVKRKHPLAKTVP